MARFLCRLSNFFVSGFVFMSLEKTPAPCNTLKVRSAKLQEGEKNSTMGEILPCGQVLFFYLSRPWDTISVDEQTDCYSRYWLEKERRKKKKLSITFFPGCLIFLQGTNQASVSAARAFRGKKPRSALNVHLIALVLEASLSKSGEIHFLMRLSDAGQIKDHQAN